MASPFNPLVFTSRGNIEILSQNKIALFASRQTPKQMYGDILNFFKQLINLPIGLASGWQSLIEKQLYKEMNPVQKANVIHYFAREISQLQLSIFQQHLLGNQKLLMIAPETTSKRPNKLLIKKRDQLIFAQNKKVCFLYIQPGAKLEDYFNELHHSGHSIYLLDHELNRTFISANVVLLNKDNLEILFTAN